MNGKEYAVLQPCSVADHKLATFERCAGNVLKECEETFKQRGTEYLDSWALENMEAGMTAAQLAKFGVTLTKEQLRLVLLAALVDVKKSRITSGAPFKRDSYVDMINYLALLCQLCEEYEQNGA